MEGKDFRMVAKTMYGLEDVLVKELETIGAKNIEKLNRAVSFEGDMGTSNNYHFDNQINSCIFV